MTIKKKKVRTTQVRLDDLFKYRPPSARETSDADKLNALKWDEVAAKPASKLTLLERGYTAGWYVGHAAGGKQMEAAKLGGITDLQQQLDAMRAQLNWYKAWRLKVLNLLGETP